MLLLPSRLAEPPPAAPGGRAARGPCRERAWVYAQALSASDIGRLLGDMGRLLGELLRASRAQDLHACRRVCGIPASVTRKDDLISEFMRRSEHPPEHKAILTHVLSGMTTEAMRRWVSMMRKLGHAVPPAKVMGL